jgi:chemotaxis protein MotC
MRVLTRLPRLALAAAVLAAAPARAQDGPPAPYELVRTLRTLQDRIALGDAEAHQAYRSTLTDQAALFSKMPDEVWNDPRNRRAAVAYALSGGDPRPLRKLLVISTGQEKTVVRAAMAYAENRNAEAMELLAEIDPRSLDASIAGHVALVRAELATKKDPDKALALVSEARLLAPGTMIEEAALRHESALAATKGDADRFETATMRYFRRFPNSVHMANFRRQFASYMVLRAMGEDAARRSRMQTELTETATVQQQDIYLSIAWEGVRAGKVELVRWAAGNAARLAAGDSAEQLRSRLCEAAVSLVTDDYDKALAVLEGLPVDRLSAEEEELLAAALRIAKEVRRMPPLPGDGAQAPAGVGASAIMTTARKTIARVDDLLRETRK